MRRSTLFLVVWILGLGSAGHAQFVGQAVNMYQNPITSGDPKQRQLESDIAVDPFNPGRMVGVAIDYRIANITGESWCSYAYSSNGGKLWKNQLFKGNPVEGPANHPLYGMRTCGDPIIAGGMIPSGGGHVGRYFFGGLAFVRGGVRKVFVTRMTAPVDGSMPQEEFTTIIDTSSASGQGNTVDKPSILFVPSGMPGTPNNGHGVVHFSYVGFLGSNGSVGKVFYSRSIDGGVTFSKPIRLDGNLGVSNGTAMAVAPDGTVYTAFRSYDRDNGMYIVRSTDGGLNWTKPIYVASGNTFFPYDQPALPTTLSPGFVAARGPAFPTLAVTRLGHLIMAWQEFVDAAGVPAAPSTNGVPVAGVTPRIVVTVSTNKGDVWLPRKAAEMGPPDAYQIFPELVVGGDWASLFFMDARNILQPGEAGYPAGGQGRALDYVAEFGAGFMTGVDRKIHTRIAQVDLQTWSAGLPAWQPSQQVSQYLRSTTNRLVDPVTKKILGGKIVERPDPLTGLPSGLPADDLLNPPNFSSGGAFIGDYNGMVPASQFKKSLTRPGFELTLDRTDVAARTVYVNYVSTQNVQLPTAGAGTKDWWKDPANWKPYNPDPANCINPDTRNTDVYFVAVSTGVTARWSGSSGILKDSQGTVPQEFVLQVENTSDRDRLFRIKFLETPGELWSYLQTFDPLNSQPVLQRVIETQILKNASLSRAIYRRSPGSPVPGAGVDVTVEEISCLSGPSCSTPVVGPLTTTLSYRVSPLDTFLSGPLHVISAALNPSVSSIPGGMKTSKFGNSQFENSQFENSQFENSQFENSQFENSQFENSPAQDALIPITNSGSIATASNITSTLVNGFDLLNSKFDFQLLFFGAHSYPAADMFTPLSCAPFDIKRSNLISNILVDSNTRAPGTSQFENRQIGNSQFENSQFENSQVGTSQFENSPIGDAQISNATLYLESGETNYFVLRSYEPPPTTTQRRLNDSNSTIFAIGPANAAPVYNPNDPAQIAQVSSSQELNPGQTVRTATFRDFSGPNITPSVTPSPNPAGWHSAIVAMVQVSFSVNDPGSGVASMKVTRSDIPGFIATNCAGPFSFTNETPVGGTTITCEATNGAGISSSVTVVVKIDKTKPTLTFGPTTPAPNGAGWNNTLPVTIAFLPADSLSGVASTSTTSPLMFTSETAGLTLSVTVTDVAGNSDSFTSQLVKIDTTLPLISGSRSPLPNAQGWNNTDVTVSFTCADAGLVQSGLQTNTVAGTTLTSEGTNQSVANTGTCVDKAGNVANAATVSPINIDKTAPVVVITSPANGATYTEGSSITATYSCNDILSGIANCIGTQPNGSTFTATPAGSNTFTVTAMDAAGNFAVVNNTYIVEPVSGRALSFDGVDDLANIPHHSTLDLSTLTLEAWVNVDILAVNRNPLLSKGQNFGNYTLAISADPGGGPFGKIEYVQVTGSGNYSCATDNGSVPFGTWTHVAAVVSGSTVSLYINGLPATACSGVPAAITNTDALLLGKAVFSSTDAAQLHGLLDEVRVWNVARTNAEIAGSYNHPVAPSSSLVGYWKFNESTADQSVLDSSASANHGTRGATAAVAADDPARVTSTAPIVP